MKHAIILFQIILFAFSFGFAKKCTDEEIFADEFYLKNVIQFDNLTRLVWCSKSAEEANKVLNNCDAFLPQLTKTLELLKLDTKDCPVESSQSLFSNLKSVEINYNKLKFVCHLSDVEISCECRNLIIMTFLIFQF